uniref:DUF4200 domain-containing protein n=1 Tax=Macrostomum lignano TaxID=282301 RepID=A0A1I8FXA3_9PLAT
MASSSDRKRPSKIVASIKSISAKDQASSAVAISRMPPAEQDLLLKQLVKIESESEEREKKEKKKEATDKSQRESRFIGRLIEKMRQVENERYTIKTRFDNAKEVCTTEVGAIEAQLINQFNHLESFISNLDVLGCFARKKQAEVVVTMREKLGLRIDAISQKLAIDVKFTQRLFTFSALISAYPALVISGYSFETLLTFKKPIEKLATEDENFRCLIERQITYDFEGEDDDTMLFDEDTISAATSEMGASSINE